ncbi:substrate-binding domain-containing protein [uncultured Mucilaginibacter sp.]|uniref:PstS family phosphate ABC transporter substrate-binding protein n=1 Tax=uncultured Mucilaginibacter sp. TaxID=797541 RepID=UPI00262EEEE6|nr:substrate-binding domain-containing protein [uncultured Mucilaginibacter sp.]
MKSRNLISFSCTLLLSIVIASCNNANTADQFTSGSYRFVFDESLSPILDQELYVFKSIYPDAKPDVIYQPENKILDLMLNNKARFAVMGRTLNPDEVKVLNNRNLPPQIGKIAEDAIALIVGKNSPDSLMLLSEVKSLFLSNTKTSKNLVFDSPNSSIINYLMKLSGTNQLKQKNVYALKNSKEVIKYVATHQDAVGFISYSWLLEPDTDYASAAQNISVVGVKDDNTKNINNSYVKPSQSALALNQYPLKRTIYIVDCTGKVGLGTGFASFLQSERGQKIILRSGLLPDSLPRREINIKKDL